MTPASPTTSNPPIVPSAGPCPACPAGQPLHTLAAHVNALILRVDGGDDEDAARLKQLGLCAGRRVAMVRTGDPMILQVMGSRLGICARLASRVQVEPCKLCH